ncbi:MAG: tRNA uridine-5-carboxymethylaminomethyl(34) synthesis GTPase MnmE [Bdellovibrionales bacterium]|nr:tRNA uridine-5-carboxymethylaminomethyl(34) synthesis GTPase MnmE [Bdellovibrionales bacterium]
MFRYVDLVSDTIIAPITAPGHAGVAVLRLSGAKSLKWTQDLCSFLPDSPESHKIYVGFLKSQSDEQPIDQVVVSYFAKDRSFTGDEVVEISCHGNPLIVNQITHQFLKLGARSAERGEFSFRAFHNGKIDLVQAESIQSLVMAPSQLGSGESLDQLSGRLSESFSELEDHVVTAMAQLEANIDFVEQDIEPDSYPAVEKYLEKFEKQILPLIDSYEVGKNLEKGFSFLLVGPANVGKSSLFNRIFNEDKAIVTDIAGTTRDLITDKTFFGHCVVEFTDSAGLRNSEDPIEKVGVEKTLEKWDQCHSALIVLDINEVHLDFLPENFPAKKGFFVFNKMDLLPDSDRGKRLSQLKDIFEQRNIPFDEMRCFFLSAKTGEGVEALKLGLRKFLESHHRDHGAMVTQARHFSHLKKAMEWVASARDLLHQEESPDLISQELSGALSEIHQLLGKEFEDNILDKIFSEFCIGK